MTSENYPVIVGVGQWTNRSERLEDAAEPLEMMARVARAAEEDSGAPGLLSKLDSVQVVNIMSWPYADAPGALAERIGASPSHKVYTAVGGETPQRLVNEAAEAIAEGTIRVALIAGAEALNSRRLARKAGEHLDWSLRGNPEHVVGDTRAGIHGSGGEARGDDADPDVPAVRERDPGAPGTERGGAPAAAGRDCAHG